MRRRRSTRGAAGRRAELSSATSGPCTLGPKLGSPLIEAGSRYGCRSGPQERPGRLWLRRFIGVPPPPRLDDLPPGSSWSARAGVMCDHSCGRRRTRSRVGTAAGDLIGAGAGVATNVGPVVGTGPFRGARRARRRAGPGTTRCLADRGEQGREALRTGRTAASCRTWWSCAGRGSRAGHVGRTDVVIVSDLLVPADVTRSGGKLCTHGCRHGGRSAVVAVCRRGAVAGGDVCGDGDDDATMAAAASTAGTIDSRPRRRCDGGRAHAGRRPSAAPRPHQGSPQSSLPRLAVACLFSIAELIADPARPRLTRFRTTSSERRIRGDFGVAALLEHPRGVGVALLLGELLDELFSRPAPAPASRSIRSRRSSSSTA